MTIAIYSRKSRFTGKGDSIANQVELCKQEALLYLNKKSIAEADTQIIEYEDEGYSGKNTDRPEFQRMMLAVKSNEIDCVICYKLDRISLNVGDFARTYEDFGKHGVDFLCVSERYDTTTPSGRAMMGMVSVFAQMERETTAERIKDNMHMMARSGRWLGGHTPTGFKSEKEEQVDVGGKTRTAFKLAPIAEEMKLVRFIYDKFLELQSISGTARFLVQNNISTKMGKDFTNIAVKDILRNPVYCIAGKASGDYFIEKGADICFGEDELDNKRGFMPYNRTSSGKDQQTRNEVTDWLIAVGKHNGIIKPNEWVKIQQILDAKQVKSKAAVRTPYKSEALLSGLLVCRNCNSTMRPHVHTSRKSADDIVPYYYICSLKERSSKVRCDMCNANGAVLDRVIMDDLINCEREGSSIYKGLLELEERLASKKESESKKQGFLESELEAKQKEIDGLIMALAKSGAQDDFMEQVRTKVNALSEQCKALKNEIAKTALNNTIYNDYESQTKAVAGALKKLKDTVLTATAVEKRELLKSLIERIVWDGEQAHIFLLGE